MLDEFIELTIAVVPTRLGSEFPKYLAPSVQLRGQHYHNILLTNILLFEFIPNVVRF